MGVVSMYMANPGKEHWSPVRWVLQYLRSTSDYCITYNRSSEFVYGYVDSDLRFYSLQINRIACYGV